MGFPLIPPKTQVVDATGVPGVSYTLEFLDPATDLQKDTYPTRDHADAQTSPNTNPVVLDSRGEAPIFLEDGEAYKVVCRDENLQVLWTVDDVEAPVGNTTAASITIADAGGYYTATDVEAALQELGSTSGAGVIGILDAAGNFSSTTVEGALAETVAFGTGETKRKTSIESRTSTTTLADDADLTGWSLGAAKFYRIEGRLEIQQNVGDFKFNFDFSSTPTYMSLTLISIDESGTADHQFETAFGDRAITAMADTDIYTLQIIGYLNTASATTADLQWAQNTPSANSTALRNGWLTFTELTA